MTWILWLFLSFISPAQAQCNGSFSANTVCGTVSGGPPSQVALTNSGFVISGVISQAATNQLLFQNGAIINRLNDRVFIAGATPNTGATPNPNNDWLSSYMNSVGGFSPLTLAQGAILNNNNSNTAQTWLAGNHSLNFTSAANGLASVAFAINDNTTFATNEWAFYGECHRANSVTNTCYGMELDPANHGNAVAVPDPYTQGTVVGIQDACGAGLSGLNPCSAAIQIVNNLATFGTGINITSASVTVGGGAGSTTPAITLPASYHILWDTAAATFGGSITVNPSKFMFMKASGQEWQNASGTNIFDCNITSGSNCVFAQNLALLNASSFIWENSVNNDSFAAFNNAGTWTFQHDAGTIGVITSTGDMSGFAGIDAIPIGQSTAAAGKFTTLQSSNQLTVTYSVPILEILDTGASGQEELELNDNSNLFFTLGRNPGSGQFTFNMAQSTGYVFKVSNGTTVMSITSTGIDGTVIGGTTSAAASFTTTTLSTATFGTFSTGAGTQTFTNSPCGALTTERWLPIKITGSASLFFIPACS